MKALNIYLAIGLFVASIAQGTTPEESCRRVTAGGNISGYVESETCTKEMIKKLLEEEARQEDATNRAIRSDISVNARAYAADAISTNRDWQKAFSLNDLGRQVPRSPAQSLVLGLKFEAYQGAGSNLLIVQKVLILVNPSGERTVFLVYGIPGASSKSRMGQLVRLSQGEMEFSSVFKIDGEILASAVDSLF